jgi:putative NADH-flavin reductase
MTVALLGATGFVGSAVRSVLDAAGHAVRPVRAPRLRTHAGSADELVAEAAKSPHVQQLADSLLGADVVINAAGDPDASSRDTHALTAANSLLPRVVLEAAASASVRRMVHVSSAVVQNDRKVLDASEDMSPFSPYSRSKILGELVLRTDVPAGVSVTRFRPPSVHAPGRRVSQRVGRIARSRLASVAGNGTQPSPQALLPNVASALAFLAICRNIPPAVVTHPWEAMTALDLMTLLGGGHRPVQVPRWLARTTVATGRIVGRLSPLLAANVRRVEVLWLGQEQARSWLEDQGWQPPVGIEGWHKLASSVANARPKEYVSQTSRMSGARFRAGISRNQRSDSL